MVVRPLSFSYFSVGFSQVVVKHILQLTGEKNMKNHEQLGKHHVKKIRSLLVFGCWFSWDASCFGGHADAWLPGPFARHATGWHHRSGADSTPLLGGKMESCRVLKKWMILAKNCVAPGAIQHDALPKLTHPSVEMGMATRGVDREMALAPSKSVFWILFFFLIFLGWGRGQFFMFFPHCGTIWAFGTTSNLAQADSQPVAYRRTASDFRLSTGQWQRRSSLRRQKPWWNQPT